MVQVSSNNKTGNVSVQVRATNSNIPSSGSGAGYYAGLASSSAQNAHESELNAKESELKAKDWAIKMEEAVEDGEYSSKYHAQRAETLVDSAEQRILDTQQRVVAEIERTSTETIAYFDESKEAQITAIETTGQSYLDDIDVKGEKYIGDINEKKEESLTALSDATTLDLGLIDTNTQASIETLQNRATEVQSEAITNIQTEGNTQRQTLAPMVTEAEGYKNQAEQYANNAHSSEVNAKTSETNAKASETKASTSERNAKASETNAKVSEDNASTYMRNASLSASASATSEANAKESETKAKASETNAKTSEDNALKSAEDAEYWAGQASKGQKQVDWNVTDTTDVTYIKNKPTIPSIEGLATETYVNNHHDSTKQDVITDLATIRAGASKGATALQTIPIAKANVVGGVAGGNWLTVNQTTGKMECGELTKAQYDSANGYTFIGKTTLENVLTGKGYITSSYHDNTKQDNLNITLLEGAEQW